MQNNLLKMRQYYCCEYITGAEGFIPSLEPLFIREIVVTEGSGFKIVGKEVKAYGSSEFVLSNLR